MGLALTPYGIFWGSTTVDVSGTNNDYNPSGLAGAVVLYLRPAAFVDATITGLQGGEDGRLLFIVNYGGPDSGDIILVHGSLSSSAANRFNLGGVNQDIISKTAIGLMYQSNIAQWQMIVPIFG